MNNNEQQGIRLIDKILTDIPAGTPLFHYTSAEGLLGMLSSGKIHCSHIFFMNDYEENLNIWKFFFRGLDKWCHNHEEADNFRNAVKRSLDHWRIFDTDIISLDLFNKVNIEDHLLFSFSLSTVEDDLNQWRSYTGNSFGFNIGFRLPEPFLSLQEHFKIAKKHSEPNCGILIKQCIYSNDKKESIIKELLDASFQSFISGEPVWNSKLFFDILTLNIFFKHEKFAGENECRMVILPLQETLYPPTLPTSLKVKKGKSFLIPYIEMDITPNLFSSITIGPAPFPSHSLASVKMIQNIYSYIANVPVNISKIPYRYW